jgi:hypothetical protein
VIAVVDFGGGNLGSLVSALERRKAEFGRGRLGTRGHLAW